MLCRLYRTVWSVGFFLSVLKFLCYFIPAHFLSHHYATTWPWLLTFWLETISQVILVMNNRVRNCFLFVRSDGIHRWRTIGWHWTVTFFRMFIAYGTQRSPCFHYVLCAALGQILWHISVWALCSLWLKTDLQFTRDTDNLFVCRTANLSPGSEVNISLYVCVDKFIHHKMLVKKSNRNTGPVL